MRILKLQASNVKRLRAVEIEPDGNTVVISGKNGQGKTSVLDSIWFALGGGPATKGTTKPIREGEERATVRLELDDLTVTRTWTADDKSTLRVEGADGSSYRSPQAVLDGLVGKLTFDPLAFAQQGDREQLATLLDLVDLPFDPTEIAEARQQIFDRRTVSNREIKRLAALVDAAPKPTAGLPDEEQSPAEILARFSAARETIAENDRHRREAAAAADAVTGLENRIAELTALLDEARADLADQQRIAKRAVLLVENLTDPDLAEIEAQLTEVEDTNRAVREAGEYRKLAAELTAARDLSGDLTKQLTEIDERKASALAAAKMPIEGLSFDDAGVTYQGVPFKQASAAEQLRVSIAMAMAMNPEVRVIRITDGSLLDSDNMALVAEMADEHDFQVWIERVDESGEVGVYIEDGMVSS